MKRKRPIRPEKYCWDEVELETPLSQPERPPAEWIRQREVMGRRLERLRSVLDLSQEEICQYLRGLQGGVLAVRVWQRMARGRSPLPAEMLPQLLAVAQARGLIRTQWVAWVVYALTDPAVDDECWEAGLRCCSSSLLDLLRPPHMEARAWQRAVNWSPLPGVTRKLLPEVLELARLRAPNHRQPQAAKAFAYYEALFAGKRFVEVDLTDSA